MRILLASASPRRAELLKQLIPEFEIAAPCCDETTTLHRPSAMVMQLAAKKAEVFSGIDDTLIIAADTIVYCQGMVFGKPENEATAKQYLTLLGGVRHRVYTGVCLKYRSYEKRFFERSDVWLTRLSEDALQTYIESGSPMDKAGAYGIQDAGIVLKYKGSRKNIMGLPIEKLEKELKSFEEYICNRSN